MDSEQSAFLSAQQKHHRYMVFGKKQRYIEVFQCSGEDMNLVLTGGIPAGAVSPAKAAALLSPGMLPPHPPPPIGGAVAAPLPPPTPALPWEPSHALVQAQVAVAQQVQAHALVQQNLAIRQSQAQQEGIWLMNQIAAAQQHQAAMAALVAVTSPSNSVTKQNWNELNGNATTGVVSSGQPTNPTVSVTLAKSTSSAASSQSQLVPPPTNPAGSSTYGPLIPHAASFSSTTHPPPVAGASPGLFLLNVPPRLPLGGASLLPPQGSAGLSATSNFHPKGPPPQLPAGASFPSGNAHPPPPHGILPPIIQSPVNAAAAIMGLKRSWEQAFPTEMPTTGAVKRQWQPPHSTTTTFHPSAGLPTVAYPAPFYPAL